MKTKKILSAILAGVMMITSVAMLSACGENSSKDSSASSEADEQSGNENGDAKELILPISSEEAVDMNYYDFKDLLEKAGFVEDVIEIDTKELEDIKEKKDEEKDQKIESVKIGDNDTFEKGDKVTPESKIVIKYHSIKKARIPKEINEKKKKKDGLSEYNYEDVIIQFETEGFTNVNTRVEVDKTKRENTVKEISIDGKNINSKVTSYCPIYSKVVITYYTKQ